MWIQTLYFKYVNYRIEKIRTKISDRLTEIEAELPMQAAAIKTLRIDRDGLKCATSTLEHDEFMRSAVDQLNEEINHRQHLVTTIKREKTDLESRLGKLPNKHPETTSSPALAYS